MGKENGFEFTPADGGIGMPEQENPRDKDFSAGDKMKRGAQSQIFDNNGGYSKAGDAGTINKNGEYGPVTYGF